VPEGFCSCHFFADPEGYRPAGKGRADTTQLNSLTISRSEKALRMAFVPVH